MKLLFISYDGITDSIGQSQIVPYIKSLSDKGADFTVLSFEKKNNFNSSAKMLDSRVNWKKLRYHKDPPVISTCYDIITATITGILISVKEKVIVVHARGYVPAMIALILKWLLKVKFIFDMRGLWAEEKIDASLWKKNSFLYKITKYFEKKFIVQSDEIIVLTNKAKETIESSVYGKFKNIYVIPTCTDMDEFTPRSSLSAKKKLGLNGKFIVIYFGSLGTFYGLTEMLDFISVLSKYHIVNPFFLIISNNISNPILETIKFSNIPEENYRLIQLPYKELKGILPTADISLMFYRRYFSKAGCCPTKFGESLACGLPVVINSGIGDTEDIIARERVGIVVEEFSEFAYKKASEQLLHLLLQQDELKKRCRATAEKYFSLTKGTERYWKVYQNLLKR